MAPDIELNSFFTELGMKAGDVILEVDQKAYNLENIYDLITVSQNWKNDDPITLKIRRDGQEKTISGKTKLPSEEKIGFEATDMSKKALKEAWLKG